MDLVLDHVHVLKGLSETDLKVLARFLFGVESSEYPAESLPWVCAIKLFEDTVHADMPDGCPPTIKELLTENDEPTQWIVASDSKKAEIERCLECPEVPMTMRDVMSAPSSVSKPDLVKKMQNCADIRAAKDARKKAEEDTKLTVHESAKGCTNEVDYYVSDPTDPENSDNYRWGEIDTVTNKPHLPDIFIKFLNSDGEVIETTCYNIQSLQANVNYAQEQRDAGNEINVFNNVASYYDPSDPSKELDSTGKTLEHKAAAVSNHPFEQFMILESRKAIMFGPGGIETELSERGNYYAVPIYKKRRIGTYYINPNSIIFAPRYLEMGAIHGQEDYPVYTLYKKEESLTAEDLVEVLDALSDDHFPDEKLPKSVSGMIEFMNKLWEYPRPSKNSVAETVGFDDTEVYRQLFNNASFPITTNRYATLGFGNVSTIAVAVSPIRDTLVFVGTAKGDILVYNRVYRLCYLYSDGGGLAVESIKYIPNIREFNSGFIVANIGQKLYVLKLSDYIFFRPTPSSVSDIALFSEEIDMYDIITLGPRSFAVITKHFRAKVYTIECEEFDDNVPRVLDHDPYDLNSDNFKMWDSVGRLTGLSDSRIAMLVKSKNDEKTYVYIVKLQETSATVQLKYTVDWTHHTITSNGLNMIALKTDHGVIMYNVESDTLTEKIRIEFENADRQNDVFMFKDRLVIESQANGNPNDVYINVYEGGVGIFNQTRVHTEIPTAFTHLEIIENADTLKYVAVYDKPRVYEIGNRTFDTVQVDLLDSEFELIVKSALDTDNLDEEISKKEIVRIHALNSTIIQSKESKNLTLDNVQLDDIKMYGCKWDASTFKGLQMKFAYIMENEFINCTFTDIDFTDSTIRDSTFTNVNFTNVNFTNCTFVNVTMDDTTTLSNVIGFNGTGDTGDTVVFDDDDNDDDNDGDSFVDDENATDDASEISDIERQDSDDEEVQDVEMED